VGSIIVDLRTADGGQVESIVGEAKQSGRRCVGVPWETVEFEAWGELYQTSQMSSERFRRTPIERLAHEIVHEALLTQSR
jgi:hypothetical protein